MKVKVYDFHNKKYGIKLKLTLDEDKKELRYDSYDIRDEYSTNFSYMKEGSDWLIRSVTFPMISIVNKILYLEGSDIDAGLWPSYCKVSKQTAIVNPTNYTETYEQLTQVYIEIIEVLDSLGNDLKNQGLLFLDM